MNRRQDNFQQSNSTQANYPVEYTAHQYEGTLSFNQNQQQEQPKTVGTKMEKLIMVICANIFFYFRFLYDQELSTTTKKISNARKRAQKKSGKEETYGKT